jgi:uncharacterized LabA/DUF88 family protein
MDKKKVIVYVDGFNFYYGLKSKKWKNLYWLDMVGFFSSFLKPYQELIELYYFSAKPFDAGKHDRKDKLFQANNCNPKFNLILGKYLKKEIVCPHCKKIIHSFEEKETDVRIATKIVSDAYHKRCDIAVIVSADSDLIPPIELIREFNPLQRVYVYFPPNRYSSNLARLSDGIKKLDGAFNFFKQHILPASIKLASGYVLECPDKWK